jgi:hypothetical protein
VTAAEFVHDLQVRGVKLVADGGTLRCRPKSALSDVDLAALKTLKPEILATLRHPVATITCHSCRGRRFWISIHGVAICDICHPPAAAALVETWIGEPHLGDVANHD